MKTHHPQPYVGRFAPSPSGPLHFGSLVTALGSYLQAKQCDGQWRLRIDDIDPPRQMPEADAIIQHTLQAHGLMWDGEVCYQGQQADLYRDALARLVRTGHAYFCDCTRKMIKAAGGWYTGTCQSRGLSEQPGRSIRLRNTAGITDFEDGHYGRITLPHEAATEDFIIHRKDGLFAYHLASVVDDIAMGITEVVRGADLLIPSGCQLALYQALEGQAPAYVHLPLAVTAPGLKLSKQNHASALLDSRASENLQRALAFLGHAIPDELTGAPPEDIVSWATQNWQLQKVPSAREQRIEVPFDGNEGHR